MWLDSRVEQIALGEAHPYTRCLAQAAHGDDDDVPVHPSPLASSPPQCRWVHVDPLTGWVDRAADVEANVGKERQPLRYVVAFAGGGAKDVTQRCVGKGRAGVRGWTGQAAPS